MKKLLNMLQGLGEASGQTIGLSSFETRFGFKRVAVKAPDADHDPDLWKALPNLLAHGARRGERLLTDQRLPTRSSPVGSPAGEVAFRPQGLGWPRAGVSRRSVRHTALVTGLKHYLGPFEAYGKGALPATPFREGLRLMDSVGWAAGANAVVRVGCPGAALRDGRAGFRGSPRPSSPTR